MSSHCDIINLPIEILDMVYKYIPGMSDMLNLAKSHSVLGKAFAFHARNSFKEIVIGRQTIEDWSAILPLCGSSVTSIRAGSTSFTVTVVKLASKYCPNLEKFSYRDYSNSWYQFNSLILTFQNLSYIELRGFNLDSQNISVVDTLLQMPKLKHLKLIGYSNHYWERVEKLWSLPKLSLITYNYLNFFRFIRSLKKIDSLELGNADFRVSKYLIDKQLLPKIELLKVNHGIFYTPLPYLPTLKNLTIGKIDCRNGLSDVFGESVFSYGKTLESLSFCTYSSSFIKDNDIEIIMKLKALKKLKFQVKSDNCLHEICQLENLEELSLGYSRITNRGPIILIKGCSKLRQIDISKCFQLKSDMIEEAVAALQHCPPRPDKPFLLRVGANFGKVDKSKLGGVLDIKYVPPYEEY